MIRYGMAEFEWRVIEPLLPNKPRRSAGHDRLAPVPARELDQRTCAA